MIRSRETSEILRNALRIAQYLEQLVASDTEQTYLANQERQWAVERLLIRFGEALKDAPAATLATIDPDMNWDGPKKFRDVAAHWYEDGLDHRLIWRALKQEVPRLRAALAKFLAGQAS